MAKTHSGGGRTPVQQSTRTGSPAKGVNPKVAAQIGASPPQAPQSAVQGRPAPMPVSGNVKLGNEVALNIGRGGPGTGRVVYARGTQGTHGAVDPGQSPASRGPTTVGSKPMADPFMDRGSKQ
jgi:hypothetical protein